MSKVARFLRLRMSKVALYHTVDDDEAEDVSVEELEDVLW